jgi:hypothetical protein
MALCQLSEMREIPELRVETGETHGRTGRTQRIIFHLNFRLFSGRFRVETLPKLRLI